MKKILEVLRLGDNDIRFDTDFNPVQNPAILPQVTSEVSFAMVTSLWGGNERNVLAMLRCLTVADIAMSANRRQMVDWLDKESSALARCFRESTAEFQRRGGKVAIFAPGVPKPKKKH